MSVLAFPENNGVTPHFLEKGVEPRWAVFHGQPGSRPLQFAPMKELNFSRWRPHPWHGLEVGDDAPRIVNAYIEITPFDVIKYEIDKASGYLRVDRPQSTTSQPPALYGFIPKTYCGDRIAKLAPGCEKGDGDPLDICVVSERPIERSEGLLRARGGGGSKLLS